MTNRNFLTGFFFAAAFMGLFFSACTREKAALRFGYSPNVTHGQALAGLQRGDFQKEFGDGEVFAQVFHAGPSIIEALFAEEIDLAFVGPVPALNAFLRSGGKFVVISGSAQGGAALVKTGASGLTSLTDLAGKTILTPQFGNTQDLMARSSLAGEGSFILPAPNPDHINIFRRGDADASWTVEPWVSRLVHEAGGELVLDEKVIWRQWGITDYDTTVLVARKKFAEGHPDVIEKFLRIHGGITRWLSDHPEDGARILNQKLSALQGKPLPEEVIKSALSRISFTQKLSKEGFSRHHQNLEKVGWLKPSLKGKSLEGLFYKNPAGQ